MTATILTVTPTLTWVGDDFEGLARVQFSGIGVGSPRYREAVMNLAAGWTEDDVRAAISAALGTTEHPILQGIYAHQDDTRITA